MRVDPHQQVRLLPVDRVAVNVPLARVGGVEPEAEETILPDRAHRIVRAGDQPRVRGADGLPRQRLGAPDLPLLAVVQADVRVFAVEGLGAEPGINPRSLVLGFVLSAFAEAEYGHEEPEFSPASAVSGSRA